MSVYKIVPMSTEMELFDCLTLLHFALNIKHGRNFAKALICPTVIDYWAGKFDLFMYITNEKTFQYKTLHKDDLSYYPYKSANITEAYTRPT